MDDRFQDSTVYILQYMIAIPEIEAAKLYCEYKSDVPTGRWRVG